MALYQNMNQFNQTPIKGSLAMLPNGDTVSCQIYSASSNTLVPGSAVKLVSGVDGVTILIDKAAATDIPFGYVIFNPKKQSFTAGDTVEVALPGSIMYMESSSAVGRGNSIEFVPTNNLVKQAAGVNPVSGTALDIATASNQLIRVLIRTVALWSSSSSCSSSSSSCRSSSSSSSSN